jgi:curved DNA-binding protein CbpA
MINYYEILNVPNFSNINDIKKSYKELIKVNHPDKGGNTNDFEKVKNAFELLKDPKKKKEFDNQLIYYFEVLDRAEEIEIGINDKFFTCIQCLTENDINFDLIDKNKENIIKCENCSMIYKLKII